MKVLYLIVFIIGHDGAHDVTAMPVKACPSKVLTEKYYNEHQALGAFAQWAALCTTIDFSQPKKEI
jgi:hypothetical protein